MVSIYIDNAGAFTEIVCIFVILEIMYVLPEVIIRFLKMLFLRVFPVLNFLHKARVYL